MGCECERAPTAIRLVHAHFRANGPPRRVVRRPKAMDFKAKHAPGPIIVERSALALQEGVRRAAGWARVWAAPKARRRFLALVGFGGNL